MIKQTKSFLSEKDLDVAAYICNVFETTKSVNIAAELVSEALYDSLEMSQSAIARASNVLLP